MSNVLIVGAHPDDETLGCGIAIQAHKEAGDSVHIMIMTNGGDGRYSKEGTEKLLLATQKATKMLSVDSLQFYNFPHQKLETAALWDITREIESNLSLLNIDIVYAHHYGDLNQDHRIIHDAAATACRPIPTQSVKRFLTYWVPSSSEWRKYKDSSSFIANYAVSAKKDRLSKKIKALRSYSSEMQQPPHPRSEEAICNYATIFGYQFGLGPVEPFQLIYDRTADL